MERILYTGTDYCAVTEDGVLVEYFRLKDKEQCGDILGGTVERIMPGIDGAFVKIGRKSTGFLPLRENSRSFSGSVLKSGMKIPVQIRKEETGAKGAYLTRDLTLAGQTVLLMPMNRYIGVSRRIAVEAEREQLRKTGQEIARNRTGIVMREAALKTDKEQIAAEVEELLEAWTEISKKIRNGFKALGFKDRRIIFKKNYII